MQNCTWLCGSISLSRARRLGIEALDQVRVAQVVAADMHIPQNFMAMDGLEQLLHQGPVFCPAQLGFAVQPGRDDHCQVWILSGYCLEDGGKLLGIITADEALTVGVQVVFFIADLQVVQVEGRRVAIRGAAAPQWVSTPPFR